MSQTPESTFEGFSQNYPKDGASLSEITNNEIADLGVLDGVQEPIDLDEFYEIFNEIASGDSETTVKCTESDNVRAALENNEVTQTAILNNQGNDCNHDVPISNEMCYNNGSLLENNSFLNEFESFLKAYTKNMKDTTDNKSETTQYNNNDLNCSLIETLESQNTDTKEGIEIEMTENVNNDIKNLSTLVNLDSTPTINFQATVNATTSNKSDDNVTKTSIPITITLSSDDEDSNSNINENKEDIEIISLISDIDDIESSVDGISDISMADNDEDDPAGYHSSDFEFITESEAKQSTLVINNTRTLEKPKKTENTKIQTKEIAKADSNKSNRKNFEEVNKASASGAPKTMKLDSNNKIEQYKFYRGLRRQFELEQSNNARIAHVIPQGDDYLDLFRGINAVADNPMEYKSVGFRPTKCMNVLKEFEFDPGFDNNVPRIVSEEERKYNREAAKNAKRILDLYPVENKKRKRRF